MATKKTAPAAEPAEDAAASAYRALTPLLVGRGTSHVVYPVGATLELDDDAAARLLAERAIERLAASEPDKDKAPE